MTKGSYTGLPFRSTTVRISLEAHRFLKESTDGVCHFTILSELLTGMATEEKSFLRYGILMHLYPCQVCVSTNELSRKYNIERSKMGSILYRMERLGLIKRKFPDPEHIKGIAPVATITALRSWEDCDGVEAANPTEGQTQESVQVTSQSSSSATGKEDTSEYVDFEETSSSPGKGGEAVHSKRRLIPRLWRKVSGIFSMVCIKNWI